MTAMLPLDSAEAKLLSTTSNAAKPSALLQNYTPYRVDWRFLPNEFQTMIDFAHYHLSKLSNAIATRRTLSRLWAASLGHGTMSSITQAGVLFIHVPKSGGTSISQRLYGRNLPHYPASFYRSVFPAEAMSIPSFAVIRHPIERFVSAYAFLRDWGTDIMACDRYERLAIGDMGSIDAVVDRLHGRGTKLAFLPDAFRSQCSYIASEDGRVIVDRLFSLNRASGFSSELERWLGGERLPHINATGSENITVSEETRHKVAEIYASDFALYRSLVDHGGSLTIDRATSIRVGDA
jgi:hypothetical protein